MTKQDLIKTFLLNKKVSNKYLCEKDNEVISISKKDNFIYLWSNDRARSEKGKWKMLAEFRPHYTTVCEESISLMTNAAIEFAKSYRDGLYDSTHTDVTDNTVDSVEIYD